MNEPSRHLKVLCRVMPSLTSDSYLIPFTEARTVILTSKPISKHLFSVRSQKTLPTIKSSILEDSTLVKFDHIIDESISQSKVFNTHLKAATQDLLTGRSMTVLVFGTTGSGKSFTVRGGEGKKRGQALRSVELLLSFVEKSRGKISLKASVVGIYEERVMDLLQKLTPPSKTAVFRSSDFHAALNQALKTRKEITDKQNKDKIHMIITVSVYQDDELLSEANFVELAGSEYARDDKAVARGFNALSCVLTNSDGQSNPISNYLKATMDIYCQNPSNVILICCASQSFEKFHDTITSLKFTARIKECLEKDSPRPDLAYLDNLILLMSNSHLQEGEILLEHLENTVKRIGQGLKKQEGYRGRTALDLETEQCEKGLNNDISFLRQKCSFLQEKYLFLLEEKSQMTTSFAIFQSQILDDLLVQCKDIEKKIKEEQQVKDKVIADLKYFKKNFLAKEEKEKEKDLGPDDFKHLQRLVREVNEERQKLYERLEASIKENKIKEDRIQTLNSSTLSYEQEIQHLTSISSEYEQLIYDLRKSLNFMSGKVSKLEDERLALISDNEKLKYSFSDIKNEVSKQKKENGELSEKYKELLENIEKNHEELERLKKNNTQLSTLNKTLRTDLESFSVEEIDKKVMTVYSRISELQNITKNPFSAILDVEL